MVERRLNSRNKVTPPELAMQWGVSPDKVLSWIKGGELRAIDASTRRGGRPRYLIDVKDIAQFETDRAVKPPGNKPIKRRRRISDGVIDFF